MRSALTFAAALVLTACGGPPDPAADPTGFLTEALCRSARQLEGVSALAVQADAYTADIAVTPGEGAPSVATSVTADGPDMLQPAYGLAAAGTLYGVMAGGGPPAVHPCDGGFPPDAFAHAGTETVGGTIGHVISDPDTPGTQLVIDPATYDLLRFVTVSEAGTMALEWGGHQDAGGVRYPRTAEIRFDVETGDMSDDERADMEMSIAAQDALEEMGALPDSLAGTRDVLRAFLDGEPLMVSVAVDDVQATPAGG